MCQSVTLMRVISPPDIPGPGEDSDPDTELVLPSIMSQAYCAQGNSPAIGLLFWGEISDIFNIAIIILNIS